MPRQTVSADGAFDFSGGVNSDVVTTVQSDLNPNGLRRNQLAWLSNGTVRGGGIVQRPGWFKLLDLINSGLWQGGIMYEPIPDGNPYLICSISGRIYKALFDPPYTVTDLSAIFGLTNPATVDEAFFVQGEGIACIQAGDFLSNPPGTLPLFYHNAFGATPEILRRSRGLNGVLPPGPPTNFQEIPAAMAMEYYQGRIWYAQGRVVSAGDIVGSQVSGTAPYNFRDSIFKVTENPLAVGGDGFTVPSQAGNIRALRYTANLDTSLGQGPLYIFTRKQVYALSVPISRALWVITGNDTGPPHGAIATNSNTVTMTPAQINNGAVGERGIIHINGDLFYQSLTPAINSLFVATRYFQQWGNVPISRNVNRALNFVDRSVMRFNSGIEFDNRALNGTLPKQTPNGVVTQGILPINFDTISSLDTKSPPVWEGIWEGFNTLQHFTGDFGGLQRSFAVINSELDTTVDIWELSSANRFENGDKRVTWYAEFPAFTWSIAGWELELKKLHACEIWIDRVFGQVDLTVYYRPDADPCWHLWGQTSFCAARNCAEDVNNPVCYPVSPTYGETYAWPVTFGQPPLPPCSPTRNKRPSDIAFQHQVKIVITGFCRIRGLLLWGELRERALSYALACSTPKDLGPGSTIDPVSASDSQGTDWPIISIIPPAATLPPSTPTGFTFLPENPGVTAQALASWDTPPGDVGTTEVWTSPDGTNFFLAATMAAPLTSTNAIGIPAISDVKYAQVRACNAAGCSSFTAAIEMNGAAVDWAASCHNNGGAVATATYLIINTFCNGLRAAGLDSLMISIIPLVPDNLIAAITPIYRVTGNNPWLNTGFVAGDLNVNGLNGSGAPWLQSGVVPDTIFTSDGDCGITVYNVTNPAESKEESGVLSGANQIGLYIDFGGTAFFDCWNSAGGRISAANAGWKGFTSANRTTATDSAIYIANSTTPFATLVAGAGEAGIGNRPGGVGINIAFFAAYNAGLPRDPIAKRLSFCAIHHGLNSAQAHNFFNLIQALRVALGGGTV